MNEKSKAFELIEFVWDNEKTDSYLRPCMKQLSWL